jgi:hypothetical protein
VGRLWYPEQPCSNSGQPASAPFLSKKFMSFCVSSSLMSRTHLYPTVQARAFPFRTSQSSVRAKVAHNIDGNIPSSPGGALMSAPRETSSFAISTSDF